MRLQLCLFLFLFFVAACGGYDDDNGAARTCPGGSGVTVSASGASPSCVGVDPGGTVTFTNSGQATIELRSGPHPTHGSCPEIDATADVAPGGSVTVTFPAVRTCTYHDHLSERELGTVQVGASDGGYGP